MSDKHRVVVTGMGMVSSMGTDVDAVYEQLLSGASAVKTIDYFDTTDCSTTFAAGIHDFDPGEYIDKKSARRIDRNIAYAITAGKKALEYGGLALDQLDQLDLARAGIIIGSGMGGMDMFYHGSRTVLEKGVKRMSPFFVPFVITNMGGGMLAIDLGFKGPNYSVSTACATGNHSIILAAQHIQRGEADVMLAGGTEAAVSRIGLGGFCACKALSKRNDEPAKASRPWDIDRDGFVMGEGSGVLLLESLEHARARGAKIYAEYIGGGITCDAYHMTELRPDGTGIARCIDMALSEGGVSASDVNLVNAHATSTPAGDMVEVKATKLALGRSTDVMMTGTKSMLGHCLGAAGGMEAIATVKAIDTGRVHPTINVDNPDPEMDFVIPHEATDLAVNVAISNSFGFGGHNAVVAFSPLRD